MSNYEWDDESLTRHYEKHVKGLGIKELLRKKYKEKRRYKLIKDESKHWINYKKVTIAYGKEEIGKNLYKKYAEENIKNSKRIYKYAPNGTEISTNYQLDDAYYVKGLEKEPNEYEKLLTTCVKDNSIATCFYRTNDNAEIITMAASIFNSDSKIVKTSKSLELKGFNFKVFPEKYGISLNEIMNSPKIVFLGNNKKTITKCILAQFLKDNLCDDCSIMYLVLKDRINLFEKRFNKKMDLGEKDFSDELNTKAKKMRDEYGKDILELVENCFGFYYDSLELNQAYSSIFSDVLVLSNEDFQ